MNPLSTSPDIESSRNGLLAPIILQQLKKGSAEDAAHAFLHHCNKEEMHHTSDIELIAILEALHDDPQTSERFLKTLQQLANNTLLRPKKIHYQILLRSWLGFSPPSAKRAESLLDYMEENVGMQHDTELSNLLLEAWAKKSNAERTQKVFDRMIRKQIQVDFYSMYHVLSAWSNSKSPLAVNRAEAMLLRMENSSTSKPNAHCYLRVIECWAKSKRKGAEARIEALIELLNQKLANDTGHNTDEEKEQLRQIASSCLLTAYHNIGNAHRAEEVLLDFAKESKINADWPPPSIEMCVSVLSTWSKSQSSRRAGRAEKLLNLMEHDEAFPQPDTACYTAVLKCIAGSRKQDLAQKAEALLHRMDEKRETKSNMASLTCVLIAWARSVDLNAPEKAERIFQMILDRGMDPDRYVFAGLITAWGRSDKKDSIRKVEDYFQRLKCSQTIGPTVVEYTAVIQAYATYVSKNQEKSRESVDRTENLLDEMLNSEDKGLRPNILSYAAVLKTIAAARRIPDRKRRAEKVLRRMKSDHVDIPPYIMNLVNKCSSSTCA